MAGPWFVRSAAAGTADGLSWANAKTTLAAAATASSAGDTIWVADDHAETQGSAMTVTFPGTQASPSLCICADHTVASPATGDWKITGTVSTTGAFSITIAGNFYCYGLTFNNGSGANATSFNFANTTSGKVRYESCALNLVSTSTSNFTTAAGSLVELINTTIQFGATGSVFAPAGRIVWRNTASAITGGTLPTTAITNGFTTSGMVIEGVDFSALGAGKTIITPNAGTSSYTTYLLKDCKLGASVTVSATPSSRGQSVIMIRGDSGATNYRHEKYLYEGTQTTETTIVRTGGATDGATTISAKVVTTANSKWLYPFEVIPITFWNTSTSAITTLTIYGTTTGGGVPNNDDIWVDVEYLGSALTPQGSFATTTKANNSAASATTNNSTDASTWGGGGAGNGFKMVVPSFTPGMVGPITVYIKVGKASSTYYVDPLPSISGVTVSKSQIIAPGVYSNELSSGTSSGGISRARAASGF